MLRHSHIVAGLIAVAFCAAIPITAQAQEEPNCNEPVTQMDMTMCAGIDFEEADEALNKQYKETRAVVADSGDDAVKALLAAQRAWIGYRDAHCESVGFQARGGSLEPMLVASCKAELTKARTDELLQLTEGY